MGAQAIAAMAYGTESIEPVDVVVGPGNRFVAEAQRQVSRVVGIPSGTAGPSEVVVIAGADTPPELAAVDLVVQAEHGPDGLAWLLTWSEEVAAAVEAEVDRMVVASPRRRRPRGDPRGRWYGGARRGPRPSACAVANIVAPEHLEILTDDAESWLDGIDERGSGLPRLPARRLPSATTSPVRTTCCRPIGARASPARSGWTTSVRHIHAVSVTAKGLDVLAPHLMALAEAEGLPAHAESVRRRWEG